MFQEIRHAVRALRRSPGYTAVALATLILGVGANTAVFSMVRGVLLSPLPFPSPDRLVRVWEVNPSGREMQAAWRNFTDWRESTTRFEALAAYTRATESTVLGAGEARRVPVSRVSEGFFRALGADVRLGRTLLPEDHRLGAAPSVVVSERFWRAELGGERDLDASRLTVGTFHAQVVGVLPTGLAYPPDSDVWLPIELTEQGDSRTSHNYEVLGRLGEGARLETAKAELDGITLRFADELDTPLGEGGYSDFFPVAASVRPLHASLVADVSRALWTLLGGALLVMLVACTNLASTGLARGTAREREYAVRHALGASRGRLVRVASVETLVLAAIGGVLGTALAALAIRALPALAPAGVPRLDAVRVDSTVLAFTMVLSLAAGLTVGALPGLRTAGLSTRSLRSGGRDGGGPTRTRVWRWLIGAEMAFALVLLSGAGLLLRSFQSVLRVDPGFHTRGVLTATLDPPPSKYPTMETRRQYYDAALDRLRAVRSVEVVGVIAAPPFAPLGNGLLQVEDGPLPQITADYQLADAGYFVAMGIPLLIGRLFDGRDHEDAEHAVVVNRAFAEAAWPGEDPLGRRVTGGGMDNFGGRRNWARVVGVVGDVRQRELTRPPQPTIYFTYRQRPFRSWSMTAVLAPSGGAEASALAPGARAALRALDDDVPVRFATVDERVGIDLAARRFVMMVITAFAGVALVLASVGVYGVVAYSVERRKREIGIRLALGAEPSRVRREVQRDYALAGAAGALVGVFAAFLLTRLMTGLLFGVQPADPVTFAGVLVTLGATLWAASYVPSLRSTRVSPVETMRSE